LKRHFRFYFFSVFILLSGCAPRSLPPDLYSGVELTLDEVLSRAGYGIDRVKAVVEIDIERDDALFYHGSASIVIEKPGMVQIRTYNLGMLTADVIVKGDDISLLYGDVDKTLEPLIKGIYDMVFWWDSAKDGYMYKDDGLYIIHKKRGELYLDSATLFAVKESLILGERRLYITYDKPFKEGDHWYPSLIEVSVDDYKFIIRVKRLFING